MRRRLKEMKYRDEKTKNDQKALNEMESVMYDAEVSMDEEDFMRHTSEDERKWFSGQLDSVHRYLERCHAKEVLFDRNTMQATMNEIQSFMNKVDKRIMDDTESDL